MSTDFALRASLDELRRAAELPVPIPTDPTKPEQRHVFESDDLDAIEAALAAGRPLLVRGEPGVGKSQLAQAVAVAMGRVYLQHVVDSRTESRDLLWREDAVARLADAQLIAALSHEKNDETADEARRLRDRIRDRRSYVEPGVLWWAFNWEDAAVQAERAGRQAPIPLGNADPQRGAVVLIDEIDKAEAEVPNGLLEALGASRFTPAGWSDPVHACGSAPLVIITTNNERSLPDAFVRRCVVLELILPPAGKGDEAEALIERLVSRGRAHFPNCTEPVLREAARLLNDDRYAAEQNRWHPKPGQAEYFDLVRAVVKLPGTTAMDKNAASDDVQVERLGRLGRFFLRKHLDARR